MVDVPSSIDGSVDIDHLSPEFLTNRHERYAELRSVCPVAWNEHHGGFWLVTGYDAVAAVARDADTFSHTFDLEAPDGIARRGICGVPRPSSIPRQGVSEIDGIAHADLRRVLNPYFTPHEVNRLRPRAEELAAKFLDAVVPTGRADLVDDLATPVPAVLTLEMMGMPSDNWRHYADFFHGARYGHWQDMRDELSDFARHRRTDPAGDITTALVTCELAGAALSDDEVTDIMWNLVAGGIETTTSLTGWALYHLGTDPDARLRLVADRSLLPIAIEEYLRHYSPNESLTRTATRDVELGGQSIHKGDVVMISWVSANHDADAFDRADEVVLDRAPNKHLAFGGGRHRCIGAHLARMETEVLLDAVLERVPDYEIDVPGFRPAPPNGLMTSVVSLPVTFPPR